MSMRTATTVFSWVLAVAPTTPTAFDSTGVSDVETLTVEESEPRPLSRVDLATTDGSSILTAYDSDDNVAAEIAISVDGLQASFDGLFIDASLGGRWHLHRRRVWRGAMQRHRCTENAQTQLEAVAELLIQMPSQTPQALKLRCALSIAVGAGACTIGGVGGGLGCLIGYYLAACECMGTVMVKGKDICDEIL